MSRLQAKKILLILLVFILALICSQCASNKPNTIHPDYEQLKPKFVLVLPPENQTAGTEIEETVYPIIYEKFSRKGYYCLAPELARGIFNANKMEDAGRINQLPAHKFKEIFGVDAILKVRVTEWSSKYLVLNSSVNVEFDMELLSTKNGAVLWAHKRLLSKAPGGGNSGLLGALVKAAVHAAVTQYEPIAEENAGNIVKTLPEGPYAKKK